MRSSDRQAVPPAMRFGCESHRGADPDRSERIRRGSFPAVVCPSELCGRSSRPRLPPVQKRSPLSSTLAERWRAPTRTVDSAPDSLACHRARVYDSGMDPTEYLLLADGTLKPLSDLEALLIECATTREDTRFVREGATDAIAAARETLRVVRAQHRIRHSGLKLIKYPA